MRVSFDARLRAAVTRRAGSGATQECGQAGGSAQ
jgi:hypothetical protein